MKAKEALVCQLAFPKPPISLRPEPVVSFGITHIEIIEEKVSKTLM